jgi:hypothetical protein
VGDIFQGKAKNIDDAVQIALEYEGDDKAEVK